MFTLLICPLLKIWRLHDKSGDGFLDLKEVKLVLLDMGKDASKKALKKAFASMDTDGSGLVDIDEFKRWFYATVNHDVDECLRMHSDASAESLDTTASKVLQFAACVCVVISTDEHVFLQSSQHSWCLASVRLDTRPQLLAQLATRT